MVPVNVSLIKGAETGEDIGDPRIAGAGMGGRLWWSGFWSYLFSWELHTPDGRTRAFPAALPSTLTSRSPSSFRRIPPRSCPHLKRSLAREAALHSSLLRVHERPHPLPPHSSRLMPARTRPSVATRIPPCLTTWGGRSLANLRSTRTRAPKDFRPLPVTTYEPCNGK